MNTEQTKELVRTEKRDPKKDSLTLNIMPFPKPTKDEMLDLKVNKTYKGWKKEMGLLKFVCNMKPETFTKITFQIPIPENVEPKKVRKIEGRPHKSYPESEDLIEAVADAFEIPVSDLNINEVKKIWGVNGKIIFKK